MEARRKKKSQHERRIQECLKKDPTLNREQVEDILKSFSALDVNGDGKISRSEIVRALQILGGNPTPEEADELLRSQDINSNGIFATVAFNRGDFLLEYVKERIDRLEAERRENKIKQETGNS